MKMSLDVGGSKGGYQRAAKRRTKKKKKGPSEWDSSYNWLSEKKERAWEGAMNDKIKTLKSKTKKGIPLTEKNESGYYEWRYMKKHDI